MNTQEFTFPSFNGRSEIQAWMCLPESEPVGIVQIVHGLGCHSGRYRYMAQKLSEAGFVVCADDHAGHGKTAREDHASFGYPGDKGFMTFVHDEHTLRQKVQALYPQLPYMMFGHSMGSIIGRAYAAVYRDEPLKALVLCGVCQQLSGAETLIRCEELPGLIAEGKGPDLELGAKYFNVLLGSANERFPDEDALAWLCVDTSVREDYAADQLNCLNGTTLQMMYDFGEMYRFTIDPDNMAKIPTCIPLLLLAGDQDPCGNYGEGLYQAANQFVASGHQVRTIAYSGHRHEIHNNHQIRDQVIGEVARFFLSALR